MGATEFHTTLTSGAPHATHEGMSYSALRVAAMEMLASVPHLPCVGSGTVSVVAAGGRPMTGAASTAGVAERLATRLLVGLHRT